MTSALLLLSPAARGRERQRGARLAARLAHDVELRVAELGSPGDEERAIALAHASRVDRVVAAGGDGTVSRAAHVALALDLPLGVVPLGTSNSVARALGIPTGLDAASAVALSPHLKRVDTALVSGAGMHRDVRLVLLAAVGLHAEAIAGAAHAAKASYGRLAYVLAGARATLRMQPFEARVTLDGRESRFDALSLVVASFAPRDTMLARGQLRPDDGLLEATVLHPRGRLDAVAAVTSLGTRSVIGAGGPTRHATVTACRVAEIETRPALPVLVDGDVAGTTPVTIRIAPATLAVAVPGPA